MALQIQTSTDFNPSAVTFSKLRKNRNGGKAVYINGLKNKKLHIQLPFMRAPFGLSSFTDEATKRTSYSLDLSFDPSDEVSEDLQKKLEALDEVILNEVIKNSKEWLGKSYNKSVAKEALYKPLVRPGKESYPATVKVKVQTDPGSGKFTPMAYNMQQSEIPLDSIEKGQKAMCIVDVNQIWFIDNKFGVSLRLQQVLVEPSKKLPAFAFQGVDTGNADIDADDAEEEEEEEFEEEEDA